MINKLHDVGKVLFIIHDLYQDDNTFPLGPAYLAAILQNNGVEVCIYCQDVFHYPNEHLVDFLRNNSFDLICLGFLAARYKETVKSLSDIINSNKKGAWFVLGGHGPSAIPEFMLKDMGADVILIGEAEETITELLHVKCNALDLHQIKGIAFRKNTQIIITERRNPVSDLDSLPIPAYSLFPVERYIANLNGAREEQGDRYLGMISSRGCIGKCSFCYRLEKGIRLRSINNIIEEIEYLNSQFGVNYFDFQDELFVVSVQRCIEFSEKLQERNLNIKYSCNARVDIFNEEIASCLKKSGCQFINFGFESADQDVLNSMNKKTTIEKNIEAVEIAKRYNFALGLNFIWGNIHDTAQTLQKSVEFIKKYNTYDQIRTIRPVTPYPGCPLYNTAIKLGLLKGPADFFDKFLNSDLITVNFMNIPTEKAYELLFQANKDLILDHYLHTSKDMVEANYLIESFRRLYFEGDTKFRGARHYKRD